MNIHENENARSIGSRLGILATTLKPITVALWILILGSLFTIEAAFIDRDYWWLGGIFGIILGYGFGIYLASVFGLVIEWMQQVLGFPR